MFLRCKVRRKDGKQHRYWSVVENTRVAGGRVVQRQDALPRKSERSHPAGILDGAASVAPHGDGFRLLVEALRRSAAHSIRRQKSRIPLKTPPITGSSALAVRWLK